jgi:hypothetical protein
VAQHSSKAVIKEHHSSKSRESRMASGADIPRQVFPNSNNYLLRSAILDALQSGTIAGRNNNISFGPA